MPVFPLVTAGSLIHQDTDWDMNIGFLDYYIDRDPDLLLLEPNSRLCANISRCGGRLRGLSVLQSPRSSITNTRASDLISALASLGFTDKCKSQRDTFTEMTEWELNIVHILKGQTRPLTDLICRDIASFALVDSSAHDKIVSNTGGILKWMLLYFHAISSHKYVFQALRVSWKNLHFSLWHSCQCDESIYVCSRARLWRLN